MSMSTSATSKTYTECQREARHAAAKAEMATDPEAKKAWSQIASRWIRLAEQARRGHFHLGTLQRIDNPR